ncbi:hypothetical protein [Pectobacterium aquaticum]|uniref:hypothetical protein n=1 Tax=Pectobacterium aquaticum TaxID=2204145 RepID=UPI001F117C05|nr:hypothetical protein [Pectobacterium aquaticum]MCH5052242.1 hypothetical protein [Pectobacterium aquaticum]
MKLSINYWYARLLVQEISAMTYRVLVKWPSIIFGSFLLLFFVIGSLKGDVERIYLNVLSSEAESFQMAPAGYMNVRNCVELPTEQSVGYLSDCVNKPVPLSDVVHQNLKFINVFIPSSFLSQYVLSVFIVSGLPIG